MKVTFENATIADSVGKAARVAPSRGEAFDKANGIVMSLDPDESTVTLRATNLNIFYLEVVDAVEVSGDKEWRFNAAILSSVLSKLPIGTGKTVTFEQKDGVVNMKSGRTTAKFRIQDTAYYPEWGAFDPDKLDMVPDFGARLKQVEWAALEDDEVVYSGIHLNGTSAMATDRVRMAVVPCEAEPIYKPITIPAGILKPVIGNLRDVAIGIDEGMFLLMPDTATQIKTRIYDKDYPNVTKILEIKEWPEKVEVRKAALLEIIDRAAVFAQSDRAPKLEFIIGKEEIAVMCSDVDMGLLGDVVEVDGQATHARHRIMFTPKNLTDALNAAPSEKVDLYYNLDEIKMPIKIDGGSGFIALVMPRNEIKPSDLSG